MITFTTQTDFTPKKVMKIRAWLKELIKSKGFLPRDISYIFVSDQQLLDINQQYLNHDTYTDIVTFDYVENQKVSGDIFISIDRIKENAEQYNVTFEEELLRVISHGVLHLMGYDDHTDQQKKVMREQENLALALYSQMEK